MALGKLMAVIDPEEGCFLNGGGRKNSTRI
jgi:hypothetical protein